MLALSTRSSWIVKENLAPDDYPRYFPQTMRISSIASLIDALGGTCAVARALGLQDGTVTAWKRRGFVRDYYRRDLVALARKAKLKGVTPEFISDLCATRAAPLPES